MKLNNTNINFVSMYEEEYVEFYNLKFRYCPINEEELIIIKDRPCLNLIYWILVRDIKGVIDNDGNYIKVTVIKDNSILSYIWESTTYSCKIEIKIKKFQCEQQITINKNNVIAAIDELLIPWKRGNIGLFILPGINHLIINKLVNQGLDIYSSKNLMKCKDHVPYQEVMLYGCPAHLNPYEKLFVGGREKDPYWLTQYYNPLGSLIQEVTIEHDLLFFIRGPNINENHLDLLIESAIHDKFNSFYYEDVNFVMIFKSDSKNTSVKGYYCKGREDIYQGRYEIMSDVLIIPKHFWNHTARHYIDILNLYIKYSEGNYTKLQQWARHKWNIEFTSSDDILKIISEISTRMENNELKYRSFRL